MFSSVKENEDYISSPAYQQLSEIDRRLYETVRQSATEEAQSPAKRKKGKAIYLPYIVLVNLLC